MKKVFLGVLCFITTLLTPLLAEEAEQFPSIGLHYSYDLVDVNKTSDTPHFNQSNFGIHFGKQTLEWRTVFELSGNSDSQRVALEVDKILFDNLFGRPEIRPYLGATVGYLHYEDISPLGDNGYYFGGNAGFLLYVSDVVDVDIGYHFYQVAELDPLDTIRGFSLNIHYFY